ncbi:MAG: hypothetical protein EXR52_00205 [Dehalococcoidia bacterium]|nr:hypothetical protein [Dehalococcoidia bacterium]
MADGAKHNAERAVKGMKPLVAIPATQVMTRLESLTPWDDSLIWGYGDLRLVWRALGKDTRDCEVIFQRVPGDTRALPPQARLLGFDVAYTNSDHFSCICDALFLPRWHGTDQEGVLFAEHFARLNEHGLFRSQRDAEAYLAHYHSFDWTEHSDGTAVLEIHAIRM